MYEPGADPVKILVGIILFFISVGAMISHNENVIVSVYNCIDIETGKVYGPLWEYERDNLRQGVEIECNQIRVPRKTAWVMRLSSPK